MKVSEVDASEFLLKKSDVKKSDISRARLKSVKVIETDKIRVVNISDGEAVIKVGAESYKIPKSVFNDFYKIYGKDKPGKVSSNLRLKIEKKSGSKIKFISDVWEPSEELNIRDVVTIGEILALYLSKSSPIADITGFGGQNIPYEFVEKRKRVPSHIAFERGYNVSGSKDLRLNSDGKVVGEVMYNCERIVTKDDTRGVDVCFGVKIRNIKGEFVAESIIRSIDRTVEDVTAKRVRKRVITNNNISDFVIMSEPIDSTDIVSEAAEVFDELYLDDVKRAFHFFEASEKERGKPFLLKSSAILRDEVVDFNKFIDLNVGERSGLDIDLIKWEFEERLNTNYRHMRKGTTVSLISTLIDIWNDENIFHSNKTQNNPNFYRKLNKYIAERIIYNSAVKDDISVVFRADEFVD